MTSIARERGLPTGRRGWLDRLLALEISLDAEVVAYLALAGVAFLLHFWDLGSRALHHDESLHATYSYYLYKGTGYKHDPLMHGPVLFHVTALMYLLFGVSDATARFSAALAGTALVITPWFLRRWLGRWGAIAASAMLVFSPTVLYYSRFIREDIFVALWSAGLLIGLWRYLREGRVRWLYLAAGSLALGFANKELTFMLAAIVLIYTDVLLAADLSALWARGGAAEPSRPAFARAIVFAMLLPVSWALAALWRLFRVTGQVHRGLRTANEISESFSDRVATGRVQHGLTRTASFALLFPLAWRRTAGRSHGERDEAGAGARGMPLSGDLLVVLGTLTAPQLAPLVQMPLKALHVDLGTEVATLSIPFIGIDPTTLTRGALIGGVTVIVLLVACAIVGLAWNARRWLIAALIFYGIYVCLFTTFFTNPPGFASGIWGSLDYWLQQQDVQRGGQPVFYYLMMLPAYAYLPLALAVVGVARQIVRGGPASIALLLASIALMPAIILVYAGHNNLAMPLIFAAIAFVVAALRANPLRQLLVFWFGGLLFGLSVAGEKMPWLVLHLELPLILLAGMTVNELLADVLGGRPRRWRRALALAAAMALGVAVVIPLAWGPGNDAVRAALFGLAIICIAAAGVGIALRFGPRLSLGLAMAVMVGMLAPLSLHTAFSMSFIHGDTPYQALVYTQTSPEVPKILREIETYARASGRGANQPIVVDDYDAFSWPWAWYLRDSHAASFINLQPYVGNPDAYRPPANAIMLVNSADLSVMSQFPGQFGTGIPYHHRWWFPEDYRGTTAESFARSLRHGSTWARWWGLITQEHGIVPPPQAAAAGVHVIGSVDSVAFFPLDYAPGKGILPTDAASAPASNSASGGRVLGRPGSGNGAFLRPAGLALDAAGNVYVADSQNNRIQKFSPAGQLLAVSDTRNSQASLREPWGVAVDAQGTVYVADTWNHRIVKLDSNLRFQTAWGGPNKAAGADTLLSLYGPRSIAFDQDGNLLVTDTGNSRVIRFSPNGEPLGSFGRPGSGPGQFLEPVGIATGPDGTIYVADTWNGRIVVLDADGTFIRSIPVQGWESRSTENKPYLAVLANGDLVLTQPDADRLVELSPNGELVRSVAAVAPDLPLRRPIGVAAGNGALYIADGGANQVVRASSTALP